MQTLDSEKTIEAKLVNSISRLHGWAIKLLSTYIKGLPDRLVLMPNGKIYFVELKSQGKKPTPMQLHIHEKLRLMGFKVYVIDSLNALNDFINEICTV